MKFFKIALIATTISLGFGLFFSSCDKEVNLNTGSINIEGITNYEVIELDKEDIFNTIKEQSGNSQITVDLSHVNPELVFTMKEETAFIENAQFFEVSENGMKEVELEETFFLSGRNVASRPSVMISRKSSFYLEYLQGDNLFMIQALSDHSPTAEDNQYIMYTNHDILTDNHEACGAESHRGHALTSPDIDNLETVSNLENRGASNALYRPEVTVVCESSFTEAAYGAGLHTYSEVTDIIYIGGCRYWAYSDVPIYPVLKRAYIWSPASNFTVTTSVEWDDIRNAWQQYGNQTHWIEKGDINALIRTNADRGGAVIDFGTVCSDPSKSYFFQKYRTEKKYKYDNHQLFAHESAHLFKASHYGTNKYTEANVTLGLYLEGDRTNGVNGSAGDNGTNTAPFFCQRARTHIDNYINELNNSDNGNCLEYH